MNGLYNAMFSVRYKLRLYKQMTTQTSCLYEATAENRTSRPLQYTYSMTPVIKRSKFMKRTELTNSVSCIRLAVVNYRKTLIVIQD